MRKNRTKWLVDGVIHGEKKSYARVENTMPSTWDTGENRDIQVAKLWKIIRKQKDILKKGWIDKRGRKQSYKFESVISIEFGRKTGRIHPHYVIDRRIPFEIWRKSAVMAGFGRRIRMEKIDNSSAERYADSIEYAVKYVAKGGWNVVMGKRRYSVSPEYAKSIRKYMEDNKKPFDGIITNDWGLTAINENSIIEQFSADGFDSGGKLYDRGDMGREAIIAGKYDAGDIYRMGASVDRWGPSVMDIRPRQGVVFPTRPVVEEPVIAEASPLPKQQWGQRAGYYLMADGKPIWVVVKKCEGV